MPDYYDEDDEIELLGAILDDELGAISIGPRFRMPTPRRALAPGRGTMRKAGQASARASQIIQAKRAYMNKIQPAIPGAPQMAARKYALGLGAFTFVNGGVTSNQFTVSPQRPFKGYRLVADVRRSAAATAELLTITSFNVGADNQLVGSGALPLEAFQGDAVDVGLALDPATPGINIDITVNISAAPAAGETVSVSLMLIGDTIS